MGFNPHPPRKSTNTGCFQVSCSLQLLQVLVGFDITKEYSQSPTFVILTHGLQIWAVTIFSSEI